MSTTGEDGHGLALASDPEPSGPASSPETAAPRRRGRRRSAAAAVGGAAVVVCLAVVLLLPAGNGSGPEVAAGINRPDASLLDLNLLGGHSTVAPDFTLTNQWGRPTALSGFRGKVVVVSVQDDRCTDLCTLFAQDVRAADQDLGAAASRVVFLAVNANPFYPQVSAVRAWSDQHGLGSEGNWRFVTGSPARLRAVWKDYYAFVHLDRTNRTVVHSTALYFVGPSGRERAAGSFGPDSADTSLFAHGLAQMADDLLPPSQRVPVAGPVAPPSSAPGAPIGGRAPAFSLDRLGPGRGPVSLAMLGGRYAVIAFWSTTCTACRSELGHLEEAHRHLGPDVAMAGIDVAAGDRSSHGAGALGLARSNGITFPLATDPTGAVAGSFRVTALPYTVILGPRSTVLVRHPGLMTTEQLDYLLESLDPSLDGR